MPLALTANTSGSIRYPTADDIQQMSATDVMFFAMRKAAIGGNWQAAAEIAAALAPYCHPTCGVRAADDDEQNCRHN